MKFKAQPPLTTTRLRLRPATLEDLGYLHQLWSLPEVGQYLFSGNKVTLGLARDALDSCLVGASAGSGLWMVHHQQHVIGCAGLVPVRLSPEEEIRIAGLLEPIAALHPNFWHQGFAVEAMQTLVDYAFDQLEVKELAAVCDEPNTGSSKLLQRVGFEMIGEVAGQNTAIKTLLLNLEKWEHLKH